MRIDGSYYDDDDSTSAGGKPREGPAGPASHLPELAPPDGDADASRDLGTAIASKVKGIAEHMLRRIEMDDGRGMFLLLVRQFAQLRGQPEHAKGLPLNSPNNVAAFLGNARASRRRLRTSVELSRSLPVFCRPRSGP